MAHLLPGKVKYSVLGVALLGAWACQTQDLDGPVTPSDDPADYAVDPAEDFSPTASEPRWVVPSDGLPAEIEPQASNANVDLLFHEDRLFMAWRTAPYHFADPGVRMVVVSSLDQGQTWDLEKIIAMGSDVREPRLLSIGGKLQLIFFQGGTNPLAFEPQAMWRTFRDGLGAWSDVEILVDGPEVPWDVKVRNGVAYMTSYAGDHYKNAGEATVRVFFKESHDGMTWANVGDAEYVYEGGVSEVAFEFASNGDLWAVTRNEDGDSSGFGSHVCYAKADDLGSWDCSAQSDPKRYDSPEMFRHGEALYLVARRDIGGTFGPDGDLIAYSMRPKGTALYRLDQSERKVVHVMDLPGCGDNAFASVRRVDTNSFLMANYTSPLDEPDLSWIGGQTHDKGTQLYLLTLTFVPEH